MNIVIDYFNHTWGYVELAGTIASLICVYLAIKQNIWTWFWGAIGVSLFGPLFYHYQLYSDAGLQILFYLPMQAVGWYWWKNKGPDETELPVTTLSNFDRSATFTLILMTTAINGFLMANFTDASFPYVDAFTTWLSVFAQLMMVKKLVESWVLWVTMDVIAIYVYFVKGMVVVSGLYVIFLVLATMGGIAWYRDWRNQNEKTA